MRFFGIPVRPSQPERSNHIRDDPRDSQASPFSRDYCVFRGPFIAPFVTVGTSQRARQFQWEKFSLLSHQRPSFDIGLQWSLLRIAFFFSLLTLISAESSDMFTHRRRATQAGCRQSHHGVAATELALTLPLFAMLVMASIEACTMVFLNHSLSIASYEAARVAINFDANNTDVENRFDTLINARNVSGALLAISPTNVATVPRGTQIALTATAPCDENALLPPWFFGGKTLSVSTTMVKE